MSNVSPVKQAMQAVLERLQAILQGCRLRMNPRKSHPHTYPQLLALDTPKAASLERGHSPVHLSRDLAEEYQLGGASHAHPVLRVDTDAQRAPR